MSYDPLDDVLDEPLFIDAEVLTALREFRAKEKLVQLPGVDTAEERRELSQLLNKLVDELVEGIVDNPSKLWVLGTFQRTLLTLESEDTEAREHCGIELEEIMDILGIESSDGVLGFYLGGI